MLVCYSILIPVGRLLFDIYNFTKFIGAEYMAYMSVQCFIKLK